MVQARANVRLLDHLRITLGGTGLVSAKFSLSSVLYLKEVPDWNVVVAAWPRDICILHQEKHGYRPLAGPHQFQ